MQGVKEWTLAIAGIVVFASLLEMLVPPGSMKRYVQLTMGLLVLLTLLTPIMGVLQRTRDLAWDTGAAWASDALSLDAVLSRADALRSGNEQRQVAFYRQTLEAAAARAAQRALEGRPVTVAVVLGPAPRNGQAPPIESVTVVAGRVPAGTHAVPGEQGEALPVAPVDRVSVDLNRGAPATASETTAPLSAVQARAVRRAVATELDLDPARIEIKGNFAEE